MFRQDILDLLIYIPQMCVKMFRSLSTSFVVVCHLNFDSQLKLRIEVDMLHLLSAILPLVSKCKC